MLLKNKPVYQFGDYCLDAGERRLTRNREGVAISPKSFDALLLLLENAGQLVERTKIREKLWEGLIVEDANLARVIADVRKALDDAGDERRYIVTVPKFGYRFIAPVARVDSIQEPEPAAATMPHAPGDARSGWRLARWIVAATAAVLAFGAVASVINWGGRNAPVRHLSIAPFTVIGKTPDAEMVRFGIQDSLITELSGLSYIAVRAVKNLPDSPPGGAGSRPGDVVLTGSIQMDGTRVHVSARLLETTTGRALWSGSFDAESGDVFRIESSIARQTVAAILPSLPVEQGDRLSRRLNAKPKAGRYYVLGRHYWNKRNLASYLLAIEMFERAAREDTAFAAPYTGMADTYLLMGGNRAGVFAKAKAALEKAIQIDPEFGEAHATLGLLAESADFNWQKAEREFQTAIRLSPNYATAHHWYGEFLTMMGRLDAAESEFEIARNLDPLSPIILTDLAQCYNFRKDYARSLQALTDVLQLDSAFNLAHDRKGYALMLEGQPGQALEEFQKAAQGAGTQPAVWVAAWAAAVAGRKDEARQLAALSEHDQPSALMLAVVWADLGENDRAMNWLERAYGDRHNGIVSLKVNPIFDPLRQEPRFKTLLQKMNLL